MTLDAVHHRIGHLTRVRARCVRLGDTHNAALIEARLFTLSLVLTSLCYPLD